MASRRMMITAAQIRAARGLLDWKRHQLSKASGVPHSTIADYERGRTGSMLTENAGKLITAFATEGVEFVDASAQHGSGVHWKDEQSEREAAIKSASRVKTARG